jgi:Uma2 family endonuclease
LSYEGKSLGIVVGFRPFMPDRLLLRHAVMTSTFFERSPRSTNPALSESVDYPDTDGEPMANNTVQFQWIVVLQQNLDRLNLTQADGSPLSVFVAGDLFWYPVEGRPEIRVAPDVMVALGRPKGDRGSYLQWREENIAPQVIFEILSPGNTRREMSQKVLFYDRYGVQEYYVYDPDTLDLEVWQRGDRGLALQTLAAHKSATGDTIAGDAEPCLRWVSPLLGIRLDLTARGLAVFYPDDRPFVSYDALATELDLERERAERERERAEREQERAEREQERAIAAESQVARLTAKLQELGIDPNTLDSEPT